MDFQKIIENWKNFADAIKRLGGDIQAFTIEDPASEAEVKAVENSLGCLVPADLKEILLRFSKKVEYRWFFPDGYELEGELSQIFSGDRHWSLEWLIQFNQDKNDWITNVFPDKNEPYDAIWHDKFAFHEVGNGDYMAIDIKSPDYQPVVYLSHDGGDGHGVKIAKNFQEFLMLTSRVGCVGGEDWQWLPFMEAGKDYINPECKNAVAFRKALCVRA